MTVSFQPQVAVVDFHHARGPEVEFWIQPDGEELFNSNDWSLLPFLALADGAHAVDEEFSYFTLLAKGTTDSKAGQAGASTTSSAKFEEKLVPDPDRSLFGIACMRQIKSDKLKVKSADVTRSTVQKAVLIITDAPGTLGEVRERLSATTSAWFGQADFTNIDVLKDFQDDLKRDVNRSNEPEYYIGLSLREMVYEFKHQTLVLFKALLLQKKMLFFGTRCERICLLQFALVSLIPNLLKNLQDCADPELDAYAKSIIRSTSLKTNDRNSLLAYMGMPLQVFGESSFFSPYTPLQLLDVLMSTSTHSFVVGSTNNLLLAQKDRYTDVLVNVDEESLSSKIQISDPSLRSALSLSAADRRWIDSITQTVMDTWDPKNPSRPTTHGYSGSEDAIRLQFEEYLLSMCSSAAYKIYYDVQPFSPTSPGTGHEDQPYADPLETANDFNSEFMTLWRQTPNYLLFDNLTRDAGIFDIIAPKHPTAGGLNIEDVQRRLAQGVAQLHLDEKVREGRETVGRVLGGGRDRIGAGVTRIWKEVDAFRERREASRGRGGGDDDRSRGSIDTSQMKENITGYGTDSGNDTTTATHDTITTTTTSQSGPSSGLGAGQGPSWFSNVRDRAAKVQIPIHRPDINAAQIGTAARDNAVKAGAYLSSWGNWARDRGKEWNERRTGGSADQGDDHGGNKGVARGGEHYDDDDDGWEDQTRRKNYS